MMNSFGAVSLALLFAAAVAFFTEECGAVGRQKPGKQSLAALSVVGTGSEEPTPAPPPPPAAPINSTSTYFPVRICNAYPNKNGIKAVVGGEVITETAINYTKCRDVQAPLYIGSQVSFTLSDVQAAAFAVTNLPPTDDLLLLVLAPRDGSSSAVKFHSHVFSSLSNSQIAIVDAYTGNETSVVQIRDLNESAYMRQEDLRLNSVVPVNPGHYNLFFLSLEGNVQSKSGIVALPRESYVVMRVGIPGQTPQMVVYPESDPTELGGASVSRPSWIIAFGAVVLSLLL